MWFVFAAIIVEGSVIQITIACDVHCVAIVYKYNMFGFVVCAMRVRHEANQFNTYSRSLETKWLSVPESLFELGVEQITLHTLMGDGAWGGDKPCYKRPWAIEPGMGAIQIAGGHVRWNLAWGHIKLQSAMCDGIWNGDKTNCRRPLAMELGMGRTQLAGCHGRWELISLTQ